jgi:hypothetical protein
MRLAGTRECARCQIFHSRGNYIFDSKVARRDLVVTAATGVAAIGVLGASAESASAYQGNTERALTALNEALNSLRESTPNKGDHRERAVGLVRNAITETQAGIVFEDRHGGG